jgi:hypothetical protein
MKIKKSRAGSIAEVVEHLLSKYEALSLKTSVLHKKSLAPEYVWLPVSPSNALCKHSSTLSTVTPIYHETLTMPLSDGTT